MRKNNKFTAIIPAAGKSKRFKFKHSKIFFKIKNKKMIEIILDKINIFANEILVIIKKEDYSQFEKIKNKKKYKNKIKILFQKKINGMATAISIGLKKSKNSDFFVLWSDQIYISKKTIQKGLKIHLKQKILTFPVVWKESPYTLVIKKEKKFFDIIQQREVGEKLQNGFSDCGFFVGRTSFFKKKLLNLIKEKKIFTKKTKEYDFLHSFKYIKNKKKIFLYKIKNKKESNGINYLDEII
jgi:bifunctional N-acetylglucosamine-1-phosphate-uridyltransferase/glucosamine-1-phosphate-acetyltransferase GlmU-like protein